MMVSQLNLMDLSYAFIWKGSLMIVMISQVCLFPLFSRKFFQQDLCFCLINLVRILGWPLKSWGELAVIWQQWSCWLIS